MVVREVHTNAAVRLSLVTTEMILRNVARRMHESAQYKLQRKTQILQRVLGNVALCQQDYEANGQWCAFKRSSALPGLELKAHTSKPRRTAP